MSITKIIRTGDSGGITRHDVLVGEEVIGRVWKVAGRSFSGAWRGQSNSGYSVNWRRTRKEVVEEIPRSSGNLLDAPLRTV